jgi:hypothetical protein
MHRAEVLFSWAVPHSPALGRSARCRQGRELPRRTGSEPRAAVVASLRLCFHPRAVAPVGASRAPAGIGRRFLHAVLPNDSQPQEGRDTARDNPTAEEDRRQPANDRASLSSRNIARFLV